MYRSFTKIIAFILVGLLLWIPAPRVSATEISPVEVIPVDGGYLRIWCEETVSSTATRATQSRDCNFSVDFVDDDKDPLWLVSLKASFAYNGFTCVCGYAVENSTIYNDSWSLSYSDSSFVGQTATAEFTFAKKILGITVKTETVTLQISCDKNGNVETNVY